MSLITYAKALIESASFMDGNRVNVDYVEEEMTLSIGSLPHDPWIARYVDGGGRRQYQFSIDSVEQYDEDARVNIANSEFYEVLQDWFESLNETQAFPAMDTGRQAYRIETLNSGYLYDVEGNLATYHIECRILYVQEARYGR